VDVVKTGTVYAVMSLEISLEAEVSLVGVEIVWFVVWGGVVGRLSGMGCALGGMF